MAYEYTYIYEHLTRILFCVKRGVRVLSGVFSSISVHGNKEINQYILAITAIPLIPCHYRLLRVKKNTDFYSQRSDMSKFALEVSANLHSQTTSLCISAILTVHCFFSPPTY